jgi:hypothetical protein
LIYLGASVGLARLVADDRAPPDAFWSQTLRARPAAAPLKAYSVSPFCGRLSAVIGRASVPGGSAASQSAALR